MAIDVIPFDNTIEDQIFQIDLEGVVYSIRVRWNNRAGYWIMDIAQNDGTEIINGVPLLLGISLLAQYQNPLLPPGEFVFLDTSGQMQEATIDDLNYRCILLYVESTSIYLKQAE